VFSPPIEGSGRELSVPRQTTSRFNPLQPKGNDLEILPEIFFAIHCGDDYNCRSWSVRGEPV
jgi:hypothetical protein